MPLPVIEGGFRTISTFSNVSGGNPWSIVLDYKTTAGEGTAEDLGVNMVGAWVEFFDFDDGGALAVKQLIVSAVKLTRVLVYDLSSNAAPVIEEGFTTPPGGTSTAQALPADLAMVMSKRTNVRGRSGRGRSYLGGFAVGVLETSSGLFDPDDVALVRAAYEEAFLVPNALVDPAYQMVVISQADPLGDQAYGVTSITADVHPDVQRRRGIR